MKKFLLKFKKALIFSVSALVLSANVLACGIPKFTPGLCTIKNFLAISMQPVGTTCYIWGGGWNKADTGAGKTSKHIGVYQEWVIFFRKQIGNYDFHVYAIIENGELKPIPAYLHLGLDCSGYRGWALYNMFHTISGEGGGYIFTHERRVSHFLENNFGSSTKPQDIIDYKAGDIMDKLGHVYICIGQCSDKSLVFVHSSPPGVQINGTVTPDGNENSEAVKLALEYMRKYFPEWHEKFSHKGYTRNQDYLTEYTQLRWDTNNLVKDPDNYTKMTPEQILKDLFGEK